jgi:hypothetical protein
MPPADADEPVVHQTDVEQTDLEPEPEPEPEEQPKLIVEVLLVRCQPSNKKLLSFLKRQEAEGLWGAATFDVLSNSNNVDATKVQLVCAPELTVLAARQQLAEALHDDGKVDVEQIPRRWGGADLEDAR